LKTGEILGDPYSVIGVLKDKKIAGVVLFTEYNRSNVEIHICGKGCVSKRSIKIILNYVFNYLGCNILRAKPHSYQIEEINLLKRFGFAKDCILDKYYAIDDAAHVFSFHRNQAAMWIKLNGTGST
jgi:RimJ/RimL family protein N-acetyltransferase